MVSTNQLRVRYLRALGAAHHAANEGDVRMAFMLARTYDHLRRLHRVRVGMPTH